MSTSFRSRIVTSVRARRPAISHTSRLVGIVGSVPVFAAATAAAASLDGMEVRTPSLSAAVAVDVSDAMRAEATLVEAGRGAGQRRAVGPRAGRALNERTAAAPWQVATRGRSAWGTALLLVRGAHPDERDSRPPASS